MWLDNLPIFLLQRQQLVSRADLPRCGVRGRFTPSIHTLQLFLFYIRSPEECSALCHKDSSLAFQYDSGVAVTFIYTVGRPLSHDVLFCFGSSDYQLGSTLAAISSHRLAGQKSSTKYYDWVDAPVCMSVSKYLKPVLQQAKECVTSKTVESMRMDNSSNGLSTHISISQSTGMLCTFNV